MRGSQPVLNLFHGARRVEGFPAGKARTLLLTALWLALLLNACGPRAGGYPYSELDTPEQHVYNGFSFLKKERPTDAQREFDQALFLDPASSSALRGRALVYGMKGDFARAFDVMEQARAMAKASLDQALAEVGMMSLYRMERREGWLSRVERSFARAVSLEAPLPEAYYELGVAYEVAYRFQKAEEALNKVLEINTLLVYEAREELNLLRKIKRAAPRSALGQELVLVKWITRGEAAGLMVLETDLLQRLPRAAETPTVPPDVVNHPLKEDILAVLQRNIQGFGARYDGSFGADQSMTRAAFATVMANVLVRVTGKPELYQRYAGTDSPFLDVRGNSPHFVGIMICSEWAGIMGGWGGYFHPMETISGVDALLVLREAEGKMRGS
jgi:tetratricopeptide (TPR) repeat protein